MDSAVHVATKALQLAEMRTGPNDTTAATVMRELAQHQVKRGDLVAAEKSLRRSLEIMEHVFGPVHISVSHGCTILGLFYLNQFKLAQADSFLQRSLAINEQFLGHVHFEVGRSLHHLAMVYGARADYVQSESNMPMCRAGESKSKQRPKSIEPSPQTCRYRIRFPSCVPL